MANIVTWFKNAWRGPLIAHLPSDLAQCETGCSVEYCSQGKWATCKNRIKRMREEIACSRDKAVEDQTRD